MKFYYEFGNMLGLTPNGPKGYCRFSLLDTEYGFNNKIFELNNRDEIIWNFTSNEMPLSGRFIDNNIEYFTNVFEKIKDKETVKVIFSNFHEGYDMKDFYEKIILIKNKFGIKKNQVVVVTMNGFAGLYSNEITIIFKPFLRCPQRTRIFYR